jgi:hypothetical protein
MQWIIGINSRQLITITGNSSERYTNDSLHRIFRGLVLLREISRKFHQSCTSDICLPCPTGCSIVLVLFYGFILSWCSNLNDAEDILNDSLL